MNNLDLGLIGNSRTSALIDRQARIVWWCYPHFDNNPLCCSLLQTEQSESSSDAFGFIDLLFPESHTVRQLYQRNSAILQTRMKDDAGKVIDITDFAPRFYRHVRMFAPALLVRIIKRVAGRPRIGLRLRPALNYGADRAAHRSGAHHTTFFGGAQSMRVTTDAAVTALTEEKLFFLHDSVTLLLGPDEIVDGAPREIGRSFYESTLAYWHRWVRNLAIPFEWQDLVIRAAITLKMNAFDDTGAIIAAVTTSIPESAHSGRNWDYRDCWLRDAYFVVNALNQLGVAATMQHYLEYILNLIADSLDRPSQPVYGIRRETQLDETIAERLAGYRGMGPVRVGNQAWRQVQNDVFGAAILASTHAFFDSRLERPAGRQMFADLERLG